MRYFKVTFPTLDIYLKFGESKIESFNAVSALVQYNDKKQASYYKKIFYIFFIKM